MLTEKKPFHGTSYCPTGPDSAQALTDMASDFLIDLANSSAGSGWTRDRPYAGSNRTTGTPASRYRTSEPRHGHVEASPGPDHRDLEDNLDQLHRNVRNSAVLVS